MGACGTCALATGACSGTSEQPIPVDSIRSLGAHQPARVLGATVLGRVDASQRVDLLIGLQLGHGDSGALQAMALRIADPSSADYDRVLTPQTFADNFAPSQAEYDALVARFRALGFIITRTEPGRTTISLQGTAALANMAFATELLNYQDAPTTAAIRHLNAPKDNPYFYAPNRDFSLAPLGAEGAIVASVVGLDNADRWRSHIKSPGNTPAQPADTPYPGGPATPTDLRNIYDVATAVIPGTATPVSGAGETVAILGAGAPPQGTDLAMFAKTFSLPAYTTHYTQVLVGGISRETPSEQEDEGVEDDLDADMVLGVAPNAGVVHALVAMNAGGLFTDGISFIVNQVPQAHTVTVSFGSCERAAAFEVNQINSLLVQAEMQGQAWFFSSGDDGTDGCQDMSASGVLAVDWPASSPYAFGVGGTMADPTTGVETAWSDGGGGASELFPKPTWQIGVGPGANDNSRDIPDVAALAGDPGVDVYAGSLQPVEGTSAAAPIWAAVWSMIIESRGHVGIVPYHERVYGIGGTSAFHDITAGSNTDTTPGYKAVVGYDQATGWGTPNLAQLVGALK